MICLNIWNRVAVGDDRKVMIGEIDERGEAVGVWTTTPCIVLVAKEYIKHDIWGRLLIDVLGEDKFGRMCTDSENLSYLIDNR